MYKILVTDDEKVVRDVLVRFLNLKGYDAHSAADGLEMLQKVRADNFDLIIMDLRMPGLSAPEILLALEKIRKGTPVIILTGTIDADESEVLRKMGHSFNEIICKPADLFEVLNKVKEKLPDK